MVPLPSAILAGATVAHLTSNQGVPGSIPGLGSLSFVLLCHAVDANEQNVM